MRLTGLSFSGFARQVLLASCQGWAADVNRLGGFGLRYYEVSRRILRMNKKLHLKPESCWLRSVSQVALTSFAAESWGKEADASKKAGAKAQKKQKSSQKVKEKV